MVYLIHTVMYIYTEKIPGFFFSPITNKLYLVILAVFVLVWLAYGLIKESANSSRKLESEGGYVLLVGNGVWSTGKLYSFNT